MLKNLIILRATQDTEWDNDRYAHCVASCRSAKECGRYLASVGGEIKELYDCLGGGTPDQAELDANLAGRQFAGWESQLGIVNFGVFALTNLLRETCHTKCSAKYPMWKAAATTSTTTTTPKCP